MRSFTSQGVNDDKEAEAVWPTLSSPRSTNGARDPSFGTVRLAARVCTEWPGRSS